ncbi:MAG TPA: hypothetical protein VGP86_07575 [Xanthobacteraceae bacterium]|nr:hypothetical protein [Xanthobacteraceae bacterium]
MEKIPMKTFLVLIILGAVLAAPAFAQHDPYARGGRTSEPRPSTVPPGGIYYFKRSPHHHSGGSKSGGSKSKRTATKSGRDRARTGGSGAAK